MRSATHYLYQSKKIKIYFIRQRTNPITAELPSINAKKRDKKERQVIKAKEKWITVKRKPLTPPQTSDAFIWEEEQNGKNKEE